MPTTTPAVEQDLPAIAELLAEMDRFYGVTEFERLEQRLPRIKAMIFRDPPAAHVLLAKEDGQVVGLAAYSILWPAVGITHSVFLKELYVREAYRRRGVGQLLMQELCEVAVENGCSRVEWMTDRDNPGAQQFYAELGFTVDTGKLFYRVQGEAIQQVADDGRLTAP